MTTDEGYIKKLEQENATMTRRIAELEALLTAVCSIENKKRAAGV